MTLGRVGLRSRMIAAVVALAATLVVLLVGVWSTFYLLAVALELTAAGTLASVVTAALLV